MALSAKAKSVLLRGAKALAAAALAAVVTWVASPDVLGLVPTSYQWVITVVAIPGLLSLEKFLGFKPAPTPAPAADPTTK